MVDIDKAKALRANGMSLQQVADELGCSLAWCKQNLKGTKAPSRDKPIIEAVRTKGKTPDGITSTEVRAQVKQAYKDLQGTDLEAKVRDIKKAARRDNADVLIRPYWMIPTMAKDCTELMLEFANEVWQFKEHLARKYRREFDLDESYHKAIIYALTAMSSGENNKLMPQGLLSYGQQLDRIQAELQSRQQGNAPKPLSLALDRHETDCYSDGYDYVPEGLLTLEDLDNMHK